MSYKHHFYLVKKETLDKIHDFTMDEFYKWGAENGLLESDEDEPNLYLYKIGPEFFDFGNYYENTKGIHQTGRPLFKDQKLFERYEHYEPFIVGKEAVLEAIEYQKGLIIKMYENMLLLTDEERWEKNFDDRTKEQMYQQHIQSMYTEWKSIFMKNGCFAINLNESNPTITTSWKLEYSIFELVRLYKTTDWERYGLLFMGW